MVLNLVLQLSSVVHPVCPFGLADALVELLKNMLLGEHVHSGKCSMLSQPTTGLVWNHVQITELYRGTCRKITHIVHIVTAVYNDEWKYITCRFFNDMGRNINS